MGDAVCIGCGAEGIEPAAYAIMSEDTFLAMKIAPAVEGKMRFHASPVCAGCFVNPARRKRRLKAHFAMPQNLDRMLKLAGSSTNIGG